MTSKPFKDKWDKVKSNKRVFYPLIGGVGVVVTVVAVAVPLAVSKRATPTQGEKKTGILEIGDLPPASAPASDEGADDSDTPDKTDEAPNEGLKVASVVAKTNVLDQLDNQKNAIIRELNEKFPDDSYGLETAHPEVVEQWKKYIKAKSIHIEEINSAVSERQLTFLQNLKDDIETEFNKYESLRNIREKLVQIISQIPDTINTNKKVKYHVATVDVIGGKLFYINSENLLEKQIIIDEFVNLIPEGFEWSVTKPIRTISLLSSSLSTTLTITKDGVEASKRIIFDGFNSGDNKTPKRILTAQQQKNVEKLKATTFEEIANIPNITVRANYPSTSVSRLSSGTLSSGVNYEVIKWDTTSPSAIEYEVRLWVNDPDGEERIISGFVGGFVDWKTWLPEKKKALRKQIIKDTSAEAPNRYHLQQKEVRDAWGIFSDMFRAYDISVEGADTAETLMNVANQERIRSIIEAYKVYQKAVEHAVKALPKNEVVNTKPIDSKPTSLDPRPESEEEYYRRRAQRTGIPNSQVVVSNSPIHKPLTNMKN